MNRTDFIIATAVVLFVAFLFGWFVSWLIHRVTRVTQAEMGELDRMAQALHEAEETRDEAITYLQQREAELTNQLSQTEAELRATMDGLREARQEADELRAAAARHLAGLGATVVLAARSEGAIAGIAAEIVAVRNGRV